jgi:pantetheine-phosphate adenylyltransferase
MQITHLMSRVAIGGTFSPLHDGHKALLSRAHQLSSNSELIIGLTSNEMARKRLRYVEDWEIRAQHLAMFMLEEFGAIPTIVCLKDPFGPTIEEDFDYLVVSPETEPTGKLINAKRTELGKKPIEVVRVEYVLAYDGQPISSTRIMEHEIDIHGQPHR